MAGLHIQLCCCRIFGSSGELSDKSILVLRWWLSSFLSSLKQRQKETLFKWALQWLRLKVASFRGGNGGWIEIVYQVIIIGAWPQHWMSTQLLSFYSKFDENGNHKMKAEVVWILPQKPEVNNNPVILCILGVCYRTDTDYYSSDNTISCFLKQWVQDERFAWPYPNQPIWILDGRGTSRGLSLCLLSIYQI